MTRLNLILGKFHGYFKTGGSTVSSRRCGCRDYLVYWGSVFKDQTPCFLKSRQKKVGSSLLYSPPIHRGLPHGTPALILWLEIQPSLPALLVDNIVAPNGKSFIRAYKTRECCSARTQNSGHVPGRDGTGVHGWKSRNSTNYRR